jgi:hypothetical protein
LKNSTRFALPQSYRPGYCHAAHRGESRFHDVARGLTSGDIREPAIH